jgi:thiamine biosynthesis lipoprotein
MRFPSRSNHLLGAARARIASRSRAFSFAYENVLGTSLDLRVHADSELSARRAETAVLAEIDRLDTIFSSYSATSELTRWLALQPRDIAVSSELADVLEAAEWWRARTRGAFHPGVQAIIDARRSEAAAGELTPLDKPLWTVDRSAGSACASTSLSISLDAIAKGYIVDRAARRGFEMPGVSDILVNVGGDIQHFGAAPVVVGVTNPFAPAENAAPAATVRIQDEALATSGGYRRGALIDGRWHSHIVDPRTGRPAQRVASASVIAKDCAAGDAFSTAVIVIET